MNPVLSLLFLFFVSFLPGFSMNNGLARTPPMGWLSWERYRCETDCTDYPDSCINANLYMAMADQLANDGYKEVGYLQVNIDDCWSTHSRDPVTHEQVPDPQRFPKGIKGVADYVHSLGLKLGLYSDIGTHTCGGYTGMEGYFDLDTKTFASWGIDMLKVDGCYADASTFSQTYPQLSIALNNTGRPIIYSCSWPAYLNDHGENGNTLYLIAKYCNLWRNYDDIQNSWNSVETIANYWQRDAFSNSSFMNAQGPGGWNDPDQLIIGDTGLNEAQAQSQMALWAIFAAPLLMSNNLRNISPTMKAILQNPEVIAVNQDPLGKQGGYIHSSGNTIVWYRELAAKNTSAIVLQNQGNYDTSITFSASDAHWSAQASFSVRDIIARKNLGTHTSSFTQTIQATGVGMYKVTRL